jgi:ADP-heptose:LPS heptosyltransferase
MSVEPKIMPTGQLDWEDYVTKDRTVLFEKYFEVSPEKKRFQIMINETVRGLMREKIKAFEPKRPIVVLIGGSDCYFRSIHYDMVLNLIDLAVFRLDCSVVLLGNSKVFSKWLKDIKRDRVLNLIDQTSPEQLIAAISLADLVFTPDCGPAHVAGALGKPTLVLVSNVPFELRYSHYPTVMAVRGKDRTKSELICWPCFDAQHPGIPLSPDCRHGEMSGPLCLKHIKIEDVFEQVLELAKQYQEGGGLT